MAPNTVKELKRLTEEALHNQNSIPLKRQIDKLQAKLEVEKSKKKAKHQAKKAANLSSLTGREERLQKVEGAERVAVEKLADATDRAKRSLQEYTQLRKSGASESELAYPCRKVADHQAKEQKVKDELTEAEKRTQRTIEALQCSLANAPSAPSGPSLHPFPSLPGPHSPPSAPSRPPGPLAPPPPWKRQRQSEGRGRSSRVFEQ